MTTPNPDSPPVSRFGDQRYNGTKIVRKGITANEADPSAKVEGSVLPEHTQCRWAVRMPSWCTGYTIRVWTWVEDVTGAVAGWWSIEAVTGITDSTLYFQYVDGSPIALTLDDILGVVDPAEGFAILRTGINRQ